MRLVLISLDAVFAQDADYLLSLPHLGKLAREGVFCRDVQTIYPSLTYPIHASLVTGCYPNVHGIFHNGPFQADKPANKRSWFWDEGDIQTDTLFSQAHKAGRECAAILWPTTGKSRHIRYNFPETLALPGENQTLKVLTYGSTWWLLKNELLYGRKRVSTKQPHLDDYATLIAEKLIERHYVPGTLLGQQEDKVPSQFKQARHMPDLLALHLVDVDAMRHHYGTFSQEAKDALLRLDTRVGRLYDALNKRDLLKDTVFAVVSDHGQADVQGSLPLDAWLKANKLPARAQSLGLGAYIHILRGDYLPVLKALQDNMEALHLRHVYTREELRALHAPDDLLLAVEPEEGFVIVDDEEEPVHLATHGFGPKHPGSKVLLWLHGPQFKQNYRLPSCDIVDIAPSLAQACGLSLPRAQGKVVWDIFNEEWTGRNEA